MSMGGGGLGGPGRPVEVKTDPELEARMAEASSRAEKRRVEKAERKRRKRKAVRVHQEKTPLAVPTKEYPR